MVCVRNLFNLDDFHFVQPMVLKSFSSFIALFSSLLKVIYICPEPAFPRNVWDRSLVLGLVLLRTVRGPSCPAVQGRWSGDGEGRGHGDKLIVE